MATFRSGFKILGELTLRQSLSRIRSYSEQRKPGTWSPEDQWAVRPPCTTCPDPSDPKKPKASKSWLSICRDPEPPLPCDIRHNNCPPPKTDDEPWYAFITKKKPPKPKPPLDACRAELQRQAEMPDEEETCEEMDKGFKEFPDPPSRSEPPVCKERAPAPVIRLSCPPPKELDLMLWCGRPSLSVTRIASQCQSDRMPYEEFRPRKIWKPPPYSLPCKSEAPIHQPFCSNVGRAPLAEYKQVEIPKPVYTRYKSVELEDENFLLCMTDAKCPPDECGPPLALEPPAIKKAKLPPEEPKSEPCTEKPVLVAASRKPVKLRCAPKFKFQPKPTKLIERRHFRNPCAQHNTCDLTKIHPPEEEKPCEPNCTPPCSAEPPKVITSNITNEPPTYERCTPSKKPPLWMFVLSKPGSQDTPLVPHVPRYPKEPDWCGETDGLNFYDNNNDGLCPKPPPDPCKEKTEPPAPPPPCPPKPQQRPPPPTQEEKFVLMPDIYNIRNMRPPEDKQKKDLSKATFHEFIEAKTANLKPCSKSHIVKESILYDFVRNCPLPPLDPSKPDPPPRKPPEPECPQPTRFYYRRYSTFARIRTPNYARYLNRMRSEDSGEKCKSKKSTPKPKDSDTPAKGSTCNDMTLPCCPKAKVPPRCDSKKKMPPCKKTQAPKPSYSECVKDPPPCQRITECNAWDKRDNQKKGPMKGRKYSSWAPERGHVRGNKTESSEPSFNPRPSLMAQAPGPYSEQSDLNERGNTNKRPDLQRSVFSGKGIMLKFMNSAEDSDSYYISESLVKKRKPQLWKKLKTVQPEDKKPDRSIERKVITLLLQDHHTRNDARAKNLRIRHRQSGLGVYVDNTSPRNIIGSIGNWINNMLKVRGKRSHSAPPSLIRADKSRSKTYVETVDVDRIMRLTKPFRDRMDHNVNYYTIDPLGGNQLRRKVPVPFKRLWNRSLVLFPRLSKETARSSMWKFEAISPTVEVKAEREEPVGGNASSGTKLLQEPSRLPIRKSQEHPVSAVVEKLSGRAFLVNKNFRENQSPKTEQLPGKNSVRCYTAPVTSSQTEAGTSNPVKQAQLAKEGLDNREPGVLAKKSLPKKHPSLKADTPITLPQNPGSYDHNEIKVDLKNTITYVTSEAKKWVDANGYYPEWKKGTKKCRENLLKDDIRYSRDKYLKRKNVRNALSKLDLRESGLKIPQKENDNGRQFSSQHAYFGDKNETDTIERSLIDIKEPIRVLDISHSVGDLPRKSSKNLDYTDIDADTKPEKESKRRNKLVRTISYEELPFSSLFGESKEARPIAGQNTKPYQAVVQTRSYTKRHPNKSCSTPKKDGGPCDKSPRAPCGSKDTSNKSSTCDCGDSKDKNEKSPCGSKVSSNNDKNGNCKNAYRDKPGPDCPNG